MPITPILVKEESQTEHHLHKPLLDNAWQKKVFKEYPTYVLAGGGWPKYSHFQEQWVNKNQKFVQKVRRETAKFRNLSNRVHKEEPIKMKIITEILNTLEDIKIRLDGTEE